MLRYGNLQVKKRALKKKARWRNGYVGQNGLQVPVIEQFSRAKWQETGLQKI
jgi:hypothetical protein